jgi:hypothetical protein
VGFLFFQETVLLFPQPDRGLPAGRRSGVSPDFGGMPLEIFDDFREKIPKN